MYREIYVVSGVKLWFVYYGSTFERIIELKRGILKCSDP